MIIEIIKTICKILYNIVEIYIIAYPLYCFVTGIFTFIGNKKHTIRKYKPVNKLAVVIAARNEEVVIGSLLDSLQRQNYPKELYNIFVIPNNCTDNTEQVAKQKGATIIKSQDAMKSKGDALKFAFDYILNNEIGYKACIVFDADNVVHPEFLRRMNDTLCFGYNVAQGFRDSKNYQDTWISSCYSLFYWTQNFFFNKARMNMGWSSFINGTGFMVSTEVLEKNGFETVTMTEDIEFAAQCAINGEKIAFVKDAITYDEQPITFAQSWKQRKRWSIGTLQCLKHYVKPLLKTGIKENRPQCIDMVIFFTSPIIQIVATIAILVIAIYNLVGIGFNNFIFGDGILTTVLAYASTIAISLVIILINKKNMMKSLKGVLTLFIFMLTWVPINIICIFKKSNVWEPIEHNRVIDIDSVI